MAFAAERTIDAATSEADGQAIQMDTSEFSHPAVATIGTQGHESTKGPMTRERDKGFLQRLYPLINRNDSVPGPFDGSAGDEPFGAEDLEAFADIRGRQHPPAIMLHGVSTRSGTVYATEVLRMHPKTHAFAKNVWEFPLLQTLDQMLPQQRHFFQAYRKNQGKLHDHLLLPLLGASFIRYPYSAVPSGKILLLKVPSPAYLDYFPIMFPFENTVVLMRDGRDVVQSALNTWKGQSFEKLCRDWGTRASFLLQMRHRFGNHPRYHFTTYENLVADPGNFARSVFNRFDVPVDDFPFAEVGKLPVRGSSTASVGASGEVTWAPVDKPAGFKPTSKWRDAWTDREKRIFKRRAGESLIHWNYAEDSNW